MAQNKLCMSRRERVARTKIIQEHHYNKEEQRRLDWYVAEYGMTYHWVYTSVKGGAILTFMVSNGCTRLSTYMARLTYSAAAASEAFRKLAMAIMGWATL